MPAQGEHCENKDNNDTDPPLVARMRQDNAPRVRLKPAMSLRGCDALAKLPAVAWRRPRSTTDIFEDAARAVAFEAGAGTQPEANGMLNKLRKYVEIEGEEPGVLLILFIVAVVLLFLPFGTAHLG